MDAGMQILLTNDDGIFAPGLAAMERALRRLGDVYVVAPSREQSGVSHMITFLTPLTAKKVFVDEEHWGWAVDGTPADCVKLGIAQIMPSPPDLIVSGINGGLNAGINVLYSGTVGAAVEGAMYGITSVAVSLEYEEKAPFPQAAEIATDIVERLLKQQGSEPQLYNLNIPLSATKTVRPRVKVVGTDISQYWEMFDKRTDTFGRPYYWLQGRPDPRQPKTESVSQETDIAALHKGFITLTPLDYDMTKRSQIAAMESWSLDPQTPIPETTPKNGKKGPSIRTSMKH